MTAFLIEAVERIMFEERLACLHGNRHQITFPPDYTARAGVCVYCGLTVILARQGALIGWVTREFVIEEWL